VAKRSQPSSGFEKLDLSPEMLTALRRAEYLEPTPVQAGVIPAALDRIDVVGQAQTGTGKTAAFVIPILEVLDIESTCTDPQALILVPTRELAIQVHDEFNKLAHGMPIRCAALYGGAPIRRQIEQLRRGANAVVGTPGRIIDHISRRTLKLHDIDIVVLDEADRMLDIGFRPDIEKILRGCPSDRQTLLLSATVPPLIERLAQRYMRDPVRMEFSPENIASSTIEQFYFTVDQDKKFELLQRLIERENPQQAIVFCRTKRGTDRIFQKLKKKFSRAGVIHGDLPQSARNRVMSAVRDGNVQLLVATDVVGRGIDVSTLSHIINFDIPQYCDDYVHRVGRTGRMGREGVAYTFVTPDEGGELTKIEMRIDTLLKPDSMPGMELVARVVESPQESNPEQLKEEEEKKAVQAQLGRGGRGGKYRRGL
jgi:ATP-dependent RNA helicase DeaD